MASLSPFNSHSGSSSKRRAGVVLHLTSLPYSDTEETQQKLGRLNSQAWRFIDWMVEAGLKVWQVLPLNHPHSDLSPYSALSAFAMNPDFLPDDWQVQFEQMGHEAFAEFLQDEPFWLQDYALFIALREFHNSQSWSEWPEDYKFRNPEALSKFAQANVLRINELKQQQFVLHRLWSDLQSYAHQHDVKIFGDMPIFVAYDSADVWANPNLFKLDKDLVPTVVAGVPPDYFSETGQRWGNPHYNWEYMQEHGFRWWHERIGHTLSLLDVLRIDHFRGLEACWEIEADEPTAIQGQWKEVPGKALLESLSQNNHDLPLVAEDLGVITPEVVALKNAFDLPGMAVLQFGFNGLPDNPHSLDEQIENSVAYSGTHDNNTTVGWFNELDQGTQNWVWTQLEGYHSLVRQAGLPLAMPWPLLAAGLSSSPSWFLAPMQDWLMLGAEERMNIPGTTENNWRWQLKPSQMDFDLAKKIRCLIELTDR